MIFDTPSSHDHVKPANQSSIPINYNVFGGKVHWCKSTTHSKSRHKTKQNHARRTCLTNPIYVMSLLQVCYIIAIALCMPLRPLNWRACAVSLYGGTETKGDSIAPDICITHFISLSRCIRVYIEIYIYIYIYLYIDT